MSVSKVNRYLQQEGVDPFGKRLLLNMQTFLLQGLNAALLELQHVLSLSHSLLYVWTTPVSVGSRRRIVRYVLEVKGPVLGCGAKPSAGHILRP